jgi:hypothetical protein
MPPKNLEELRRQQLKALRESAGAWKPEDHPELKDGGAAHVHQMREADKAREDERIQRAQSAA